ncbi:MAG: undecaprenyl-diphosphate phosphatase [Bacteroidetes bacterium]|nr:undecaprenyl-diphosphate phosphatase [Bacteroidota bacterium]
MSIIDAIVLALVQGVTEFLPISSSGHLVILQSLLNLQSKALVGFDVYVHFGTLLSLLFVYRNDVINLVRGTVKSLMTMKVKEMNASSQSFHEALAIVVGCVPAGVIGVVLREEVEYVFQDPKMVAVNLVITGLILFLTRLAQFKEHRKLTLVHAFFIGVAQAVAILPGISRSGMTIAMGLFLGLSPICAARFSFLLSIPIIAGAAILETKHITQYALELGLFPIVIGVSVAALSGYWAIRFLLRIVQRGKFNLFAFYCLVVGSIALIAL